MTKNITKKEATKDKIRKRGDRSLRTQQRASLEMQNKKDIELDKLTTWCGPLALKNKQQLSNTLQKLDPKVQANTIAYADRYQSRLESLLRETISMRYRGSTPAFYRKIDKMEDDLREALKAFAGAPESSDYPSPYYPASWHSDSDWSVTEPLFKEEDKEQTPSSFTFV